jgi:cysteine desulfurase / selenocysteine lyase
MIDREITMDIELIRSHFPILSQEVHNRPLVYLDNAATTQKPLKVIETIDRVYKTINSNVHRGVHHLSDVCTDEHEQARMKVQQFIHAEHSHEIIFTSGTTASINLVAYSFGEKYVKEGDEIIISAMEHHSNMVPWQMLCERKKAVLKIIPMSLNGELELDKLPGLISGKTRIIAVGHVSNSLGTVNPVKEIIELAHANNIPVLVDGAQAVQHGKVDVQELDCDFYVFSGHKAYGPTGIGVLYGKEKWLNEMPPWQGGGEMIKEVSFSGTVYNDLPFKFEAGTPNFVGAIALGAALDYLNEIGLDEIACREKELLEYATQKLQAIPGLVIVGNAREKISVISFYLEGIHPYDTGMVLDKLGIAVRTGNHCAQPVMDFLKLPGTVRASFVFYNTREEIDALTEGVLRVKQMFS